MNINCRFEISPCAECETRTDDCHGRCKRYADWRESLKQKTEVVAKARRKFAELENYQRSQVHKVSWRK